MLNQEQACGTHISCAMEKVREAHGVHTGGWRMTSPSSAIFRAGASLSMSPVALPPGDKRIKCGFGAIMQDTSLCTSSDVIQLQGPTFQGWSQLPEPLSRTATLLSPHSGTALLVSKRPTEKHMQQLGRQPAFLAEYIS